MIQLRDYQIPAVEALSRTHRGIVKAPAGCGKTIIAAASILQWLKYPDSIFTKKVAWVANTNEQVTQGKDAVALFPLIYEWARLDFYCYAGCPSLAGYDLAIFDECHHIGAPFFRNIVKYHEGARWGLSATPDRADEFKADVYTLIGPIIHTVDRAPLVAAGQITAAQVFIHSPNFKGEMERDILEVAEPEYERRRKKWPFLFNSPTQQAEQMKRCVWQAALDIGVTENQKRNSLVIALSNRHVKGGDSVLVLVNKIEHGEKLAELIPGSVVVFSKMGAKKRREAIRAFGAGEIKCMIATSLADEGLDVPRANVLIQVSAGRSAAKAEQRTGRVLRAFHDAEHGPAKTHGVIHDFSDLQHYFLSAQSRQRKAVYVRLGYNITVL